MNSDAAPPLADTHCHLALLEERGLLGAALDGAGAAGVTVIVTVGLNLEDSQRNREIAEEHPGVWFSVGWHPHEPAPPDASQLAELSTLLAHPRAVAVGEIGLDCFWRPGYHEVPLETQVTSLRLMLELAAEHGKPVLLHDREAHDVLLAELDRLPQVRGVMHCFSGDATHAQRCIDRGHVVSFSGIITFPSAGDIREAARSVAADAFVVETDSPFLSPVPHRGQPNLPERVAFTAAEVARLRGEDVAAVRRRTTATAARVLGLPVDADGHARPH